MKMASCSKPSSQFGAATVSGQSTAVDCSGGIEEWMPTVWTAGRLQC